MGRMIACDNCNDTIHQEDAEQGWYRLTQEQFSLERWFCSPGCIVAHVTAHQDDLGIEDGDDDDTTG